MRTAKREHAAGLIERVQREPHRYQFAQLITILLRLLRQQGISYEHAFRDVLRFRNSLSLTFPPSDIRAVEFKTAPSGLSEAATVAPASKITRIRITPAFMGLLGASGTLPLHDTERLAMHRARGGDASQHELIDLFSNRVMGLFYQAWGQHRVEHSLEVHEQDRLLPMLTALAGINTRNSSAAVQGAAIGFYSGLLGTRPVAASTVERVLSEHFGLPIHLEQYVGSWDAIPENRRSTLGTGTPILGAGAALGLRVWRHDLRARLHIGPLDETQMQGFLPGGEALLSLEKMVRLLAVPTLRYEVRLLLGQSCVKRMTLTTRSERRRLGWDTFLTSTQGLTLRPQVGLILDPTLHAQTSMAEQK